MNACCWRSRPARPWWRAVAVCVLVSVSVALAGTPLREVHPAAGPPAATRSLDPARATVPLEQFPGLPAPTTTAAASLADEPAIHALVQEARELIAERQFAQAVERLDRALNDARQDYYDLAYLTALAKFHLGDFGQARVFAERAAALHPAAADAHYLLGRLFQRHNQLDRAIEHLRTATLAVEREPDNPRVTAAWFQLGECLVQAGYLSAAEEAYARFDQTLGRAHPDHRGAEEIEPILERHAHGMIEARLALLRQLGRPADAVAAAAEACELQPDNVYLARLHAQALLDADRPADALDFCRARLRAAAAASVPGAGSDPLPTAATSPFVSIAVRAAIATGRLSDWLTEVSEDVAGGRGAALARALADRLSELEQPVSAAVLWRALAEHDPQDAEATWALAVALRAAGRLEAAVDAITAFVRDYPSGMDVPWARFEAWLKPYPAGDEPLRLLARRAAEPQRDFAADFALGTLAAAVEQTELAEQLLGAALAGRRDLVLAHVARGQLLLSTWRWEEALAAARAALEVHPHLAAAHYLAGCANTGLDRHKEAEEAYLEAVRHAPRDPAYVLVLAEHYRRAGNLLASQRYFQQTLQLDPTSARAFESLVESYLAGGKIELAQTQLRKAETRDVPDDTLRRMRTTLSFARNLFQEEHLAELARQFDELPDDVETGLKLAAGLYLRERIDEARQRLEQVLTRAPHDERGLLLMARVLARQLHHRQATQVLEKLIQRHPRRQEALTLLAENHLADFQLNEARRAIRRLLELDLTDQQRLHARRWLLQTYIEFMEYDGALHLLDEWLADEPDAGVWVREKLRVLVLAGRGSEALTLAEERLEPVTRPFEQSLARFQELFRQLRDNPRDTALQARSEQQQRELEELRRELVTRRAELVQVALELRRFRLAEQHVRRWCQAEPNEEQNVQWLVQILLADDRPDEALAALAGFRAMAPAVARGWRARAEAAAGRVDQAVTLLDDLLEDRGNQLPPDDRDDLHQQVLAVLMDAGRYDEALRRLDAWSGGADGQGRAAQIQRLAFRALILQRAGRTDDYLATAEEWYRLDPDNVGLNNDLGYTWVDRGLHLSRATQMIRKAVASQPLRAAFLDSLGWAGYMAGDFALAVEYLGRAARLREGQNPVIFDHLGDACWRTGDVAAARRHWDKALKLLEQRDPEHDVSTREELLGQIRAKLDALERSGPPPVAPTAEERGQPRE